MKYLPCLLCILGLLFFPLTGNSQPACLELQWEQSYGGSQDDWAKSIHPHPNGGYLLTGASRSSDGNVSANAGSWDYWVIRIDDSGTLLWETSIGGSDIDQPKDIKPTADGGFIVVGGSNSLDLGLTSYGNTDIWVTKYSAAGGLEWQENYGGSNADVAEALVATPDGGYIITGYTESRDFDVGDNLGNFDFWVFKINGQGTLEWERNYGGSVSEFAFALAATPDGNYVATGSTFSEDGDVTNNKGLYDFWIIKFDGLGNLLWQKSYGGALEDRAYELLVLAGGDIVVTGSTNSAGGDIPNLQGGLDFWVIRLNPSGNLVWSRSFGGTGSETPYALTEIEEGIVIAGATSSVNGDVPGNNGQSDFWVLLLNDAGELRWTATYGGQRSEQAESACPSGNGGFLVAGYAQSSDGDVSANFGGRDFWVIQIDPRELQPDLGSDTLLCPNATLLLESDVLAQNYLWQDGSDATGFTVETPGTYWLMVQDEGCVGIDSIEVDYLPADVLTPNQDMTLCLGDTLILQAWQGGANYEWQDGSDASSYEVTESGTYALTVSTSLCEISNEINVDFSDHQPRLGRDVTLCGDESLTLNATVDGPAIYTWQDGAVGATYDVQNPGTYIVNANILGCVQSDTVEISYLSDPGELLSERTTICENEIIELNVFRDNAYYFWDDGSTEPNREIRAPGTYRVELDFFNCSFRDTIQIDPCDACLFLPNAFSPNGDGYNDAYRSKGACELFDFQMVILNRWGQAVFSTTDPTDGWDGKTSGRQSPQGVYACRTVYKIRNNGKLIPQEKSSPVLLIR